LESSLLQLRNAYRSLELRIFDQSNLFIKIHDRKLSPNLPARCNIISL
jgi:hypothetical protein